MKASLECGCFITRSGPFVVYDSCHIHRGRLVMAGESQGRQKTAPRVVATTHPSRPCAYRTTLRRHDDGDAFRCPNPAVGGTDRCEAHARG